MPITPRSSRAVILVKALPQPSRRYGETVCCAGVTLDRRWKRLYPVRFRHLQGDQGFSRWDWVKFRYTTPVRDKRQESCHVFEDSIVVDEKLPEKERPGLLSSLIVGSAKHAMDLGQSLALIRPRNTRFLAKSKSRAEIEEEREAYQLAARQDSFFDERLAALEPSPYDFRFIFEDENGKHDYQNGDWEAHAMFWRERNRTNEEQALKWMYGKFNEEFPRRGMVFAIGNQAKRPQVWQLLGVIRLDEARQGELLV